MVLARALAYPYDLRKTPFLFDTGGVRPFRVLELRCAPDTDGLPRVTLFAETDSGRQTFDARIPLIASGSNAAPEQLQRKFGHTGTPAPIPVLPVAAAGLIAVHSAHVARYGAIPATLAREVGIDTILPLLLPDRATLKAISATEALGVNYDLVRLDGLDIGHGRHRLGAALAFRSRHGVLAPTVMPLRLAAFPASGSRIAGHPQRDILETVRSLVGCPDDLAAFVDRLVRDDDYRRSVTALLHRYALPDGLKATPLRL